MTNPTKPLDIEARELLARHWGAGRPALSWPGANASIPADVALAAISELLTRLRKVEDSEKDWKRRAGLHSRQTSNTQERLDKMRIERDASQALLGECLGRANDVSALKEIVREHFYAGPLDGCTERLATVLSRHIQGLPLRTPEEEEALRVSNLNAEDRKAYWIERNRAASLIEKLEPKPESAIERVAFYYSGGKRHGPGPWPMNKQAGIVLSRNGFRVKVLGDDGVEYDIDSALIEKLEGRG